MLFLTNVLRSTGTMSFNLLIQLRMKEIGATLFLIGLLSSLRGAVNTFSNVFWGRISDRTGKRRVFIISSLVLASAFYPLYAVVDVPSAILIVSMIIAFFNGMYPPAAMALSSTTKRMALGFSLYNSSNSLGMFFSRLSIGFLLMFMNLKLAFVFFSIVVAMAVIPALRVKEEGVQKKKEDIHFRKTNHETRNMGAISGKFSETNGNLRLYVFDRCLFERHVPLQCFDHRFYHRGQPAHPDTLSLFLRKTG
ncbi:Major facilitator superfamily MFS_1 precursor [Thermotoga neapolitana DSM 4359]|uniref:Major facilitator superfamily MFS_1 n=1 Tax=Thermotoga neapolitana (strain ATCC 49049 / DSM 4359 / NBRC 107923 / NS-E) TaxID=309803 RepID=B9KBS8_THENN|nr:Major facilitator superfamily MFS_1 precursor [Thermotoga neapolitana DSM 4359]